MQQIDIECAELESALDFYTCELGFRIDSIFPADAPRNACLSGHGLVVALRLHDDRSAATPPVYRPALVVTKYSPGEFGAGRAGMQYRDLIPDRFGGRFIASHIRIPHGGPVPDYVHHHEIEFQLIFCVKGWVSVVYEDQGEPMRLEAGDCFLQPPHIRHRVLECSDGMEVVEIASPAEHITLVDHEMDLPTPEVDPQRDFGGQKFVFHRARKARWSAADLPGLAYRNTGVAAATGGIVSAVVLRTQEGCPHMPLRHGGELRFIFVLQGQATLQDHEATVVEAGDAVAIPAGMDAGFINLSRGFSALEVIVPSQLPGRQKR
jgi:quercetin dioxygenase-like cupin family protein